MPMDDAAPFPYNGVFVEFLTTVAGNRVNLFALSFQHDETPTTIQP
jgi:hypothetical protein